MAVYRPFAYNPSQILIPGCEQIGDLAIGVPTNGFDSTGLDWWVGPDEENSVIIAYSQPSGDHPTSVSGIFASLGFQRTSESFFVNFVNTYYNAGVSTPADAKTWLNTNGYWTSYGIYPESLIVYLDSGNSSSYPGSGSTWTDLTTPANNATLFNTPTFSTPFEGILQFDDASLEYATIPNIGDLPQWTVEAWVRITGALTTKVSAIVTNQFNLSTKLNFSIGTNNAPTNRNIAVGFFDGAWRTTAGFVPVLNTWYQIVGTYDGTTIRQYVNGVANGGTLTYSGNPQSGGEVRLMRRWDDILSSGNFIDGDLAIVKIYNTALSPTDVLSNYNLKKNRFSVVLYYDPGDTNSYPGSGTTISSLVTPQYNGTLVGSITYDSVFGSLVFPSSNTTSYITIGKVAALQPTEEISVEQWISPDDWVPATGRQTISCTQGGGYAISLRNNAIDFIVFAGGSYRSAVSSTVGFTGWKHIVATFDGRYTKLYINGVLTNTTDAGATFTISYNATNGLFIGAEAGSSATIPDAGQKYEGKISQTLIYNQALSSTEVLNKFNAEKTRYGI